MQGGCNAPIGGHAVPGANDALRLEGRVLATDGSRVIEGSVEGSAHEPSALGVELARILAARGGDVLVTAAREGATG